MADQDPFADFTPIEAPAQPTAPKGGAPDPFADFTPIEAAAPSAPEPKQEQRAPAEAAPAYASDSSFPPASAPYRPDMSRSEYWSGVGANALPSVGRMASGVWDAAKGSWDALTSPDAATRETNDPVTGLGKILHSGEVYAGDKLRPWLGDKVADFVSGTQGQTPEQRAEAIKPGADFLQSYADKYTAPGFLGKYTPSLGAAEKAFYYDPAGVAVDAATLADPALRLGKAAKAATFGEPLSEAGLGESLRNAAQASDAARDAAYTKAYSHTGVFNPSAAHEIWDNAVTALTSNPTFPTSPAALARSKSLSNVKEAMDTLGTHLSQVDPNDFTMPQLERWRRDLRSIANRQGTSLEEKGLIGNMIEGFDNGAESAASKPGVFSGDGAAAVQDMQAARAAHVQHLANFGKNAPTAVKSAMGAFPDDLGAASAEQLHQAGAGVGKGMLDPTKGPAVYQHLHDLGLGNDVDSYLRSKLLSGSSNDVTRNLSRPVTSKVFSPEDVKRAQALNENQEGSRMARLAGPAASLAGRVGAVGMGLFRGSPIEALGNAVIERGIEHAAHRAFTPQGSLYERFTNPPGPGLSSRLMGKVGQGASRLNAIENGQQAVEDRPAHARGGKVGHQHLVDQLFRSVERAKRAEKARTSAILQQPDTMVAKALNVAQEAI